MITFPAGVPSSDGCDNCSTVEVEETADEVVLRLSTGEEAGDCNDLGGLGERTVLLAAALGDRLLVDGLTGQPIDLASPDD